MPMLSQELWNIHMQATKDVECYGNGLPVILNYNTIAQVAFARAMQAGDLAQMKKIIAENSDRTVTLPPTLEG